MSSLSEARSVDWKMPTAGVPATLDEEGHGGEIVIPAPQGTPSSDAESKRAAGVNLDKEYLYSCKFCFKVAKKPVVSVICGHLFCWPCLFGILRCGSGRQSCPCCSSHLDITLDNMTVIPVYSGPYPTDSGRRIYNDYLYGLPERSFVTGEDLARLWSSELSEDDSDDESDDESLEDPEKGKGKKEQEKANEEEWKRLNQKMPVKDGLLLIEKRLGLRPTVVDGMPPTEAPCCPHILNCARNRTLSEFITTMLSPVQIFTSEVFSYNVHRGCIFEKIEHEKEFLREQLLERWKWLTGKEYPNGSGVSLTFSGMVKVKKHLRIQETTLQTKITGCVENVQQSSANVDAAYTANSISMFSCGCCHNIPHQPVVTHCGHLFCWSCLYHMGCSDEHKHNPSPVCCPACTSKVSLDPRCSGVQPINGSLTLPKDVAEFFIEASTGSHQENIDNYILQHCLNPADVSELLRKTIDGVLGKMAELEVKISSINGKNATSDDIEGIFDEIEGINASVYASFGERVANFWREKLTPSSKVRGYQHLLQSGLINGDTSTSCQPEDNADKRLKTS